MDTTPNLSYWICATPRVGSTLLCHVLALTGIAGKPEEFFLEENVEFKMTEWEIESFEKYLQAVFRGGTTLNGVFGVKMEPGVVFRYLESQVRSIPKWNNPKISIHKVFENIFPNLKFIWVTRRNKVRQAVSWWKAVQTGEWGQLTDKRSQTPEIPEYAFESIDHLFNESSMREASWQNHFEEWSVQPLTLVYEDFIEDFEGTVELIMNYLGIDDDYEFRSSQIKMVRQADDLSEEWVQRYREEKQKDWSNLAW